MIKIKKLKKILYILLLSISNLFFSQKVGDYISNVTNATPTNWNLLNSWLIWDGDSYELPTAAQGWPGQFASSSTANVTISTSDIIVAPTGTTYPGLTVGKLTVNGQLNVNADFYLNTEFLIIQNLGPANSINSYDLGTISLDNNNTELFLIQNVKIELLGNSRVALSTTAPSVDNNFFASPSPCNSLRYVKIRKADGTYLEYANCNGSGVPYSFAEMNAATGSIFVDGTASPDLICGSLATKTTSLSSQIFNQVATSTYTILYSWTLQSKPAASTMTFNSSVQNPGTVTLSNVVGTYVFRVTATVTDNTAGFTQVSYDDVVVTVYPDNDGDCVADNVDLDDDNDGILDANEVLCQTSALNLVTYTSSGLQVNTTSSNLTYSPALASETFTIARPANTVDTSADPNLLRGDSDGTLRMGVNASGQKMVSIIKFSKPTKVRLSQGTFNGYWFDSNDSWNIQSNIGNMKVITNNVITTSTTTDFTNNAGSINSPELTSITGDNTNSLSFIPGASGGHLKKTLSQWIVESTEYITQLTITYTNSSNATAFAQRGQMMVQALCVQKDTDGDGIFDSLDLDSDADGCPDVIEGGANFTSGATYITNNALNTTVDANGVPAVPTATPAITGYTQANGQTVGYSTNNTINGCFDADLDGLPDALDLDDDNDGILDTTENAICVGPLINNTFETSGVTGSNINSWVQGGSGAVWFSTAAAQPIQFEDDNISSTSPMTLSQTIGSGFAWGSGPKTISFDLKSFLATVGASGHTAGGAVLEISYEGVTYARLSSPDTLIPNVNSYPIAGNTTITALNGASVSATTTPTERTTTMYPLTITLPSSVTSTTGTLRFSFYTLNNNGTQADNDYHIDNVNMSLFCDTDSDGTPNYLDTDSDGDGCFDAIEGTDNVLPAHLNTSGSINVGANGTGTLEINGNGVPKLVNDATNNATGGGATTAGVAHVDGVAQGQNPGTAYDSSVKTCTDTDEDGIPNNLDIDDDNDGVLDTVENPYACTTTTANVLMTETFGVGIYGSPLSNGPTTQLSWFTGSGTGNPSTAMAGGEYAIVNNPDLIDDFSSVGGSNNVFTNTADHTTDTSGLMMTASPRTASGVNAVVYKTRTLAINSANISVSLYALRLVGTQTPSIDIEIFNADTNTFITKVTGKSINATTWGEITADFNSVNMTAAQATGLKNIFIQIVVNGGTNYDIALDDIKITENLCDFDGDGIANQFDLDSDGDGCPDAAEAGVKNISGVTMQSGSIINGTPNVTTTGVANAIVAGPYGTNGFANSVETSTDSGVYSGTYTYSNALNSALQSGCACYENPSLDTDNTYPSKHGITLLKRAGTHTGVSTNGDWPMLRQSGHTVLESNKKPFVITRIAKADLGNIANPVVGMMVFDTTDKCLKIYTGDPTGVNGWKCFSTPACPTN